MAKDRAGLKTIAEALNLSVGTISRALSGRGDIAEDTRAQIAAMAASLNYAPRRGAARSARELKRVSVCVGNLCLGADGALDPTYVGLHYLVEFERAASAAHLGVLVGFIDASADARELERLPVLQRDETQGLVLVYPFPEAIVRQLAAHSPVVSIEHVYPGVSLDTVGPAHALDAMSAVAHLGQLGHRRIAYVGDEDARGHRLTVGLRHAGFVAGLTRAGLPYRADDVVNVHTPFVEKAALADWVCGRVDDGVTAVITSIDRHGYLLWNELPARGVQVPKKVSIAGIGGIHRSAGQSQLTTWRCNYEEIARTALDALHARRSGRPTTDLYQEIAGVFVAGESCGPPR